MRIFIAAFLLLTGIESFPQTGDYRTTEDGINKLLNNPEFVKDVLELNSSSFHFDKLSDYFSKYAPEYAGFRPTGSIDESKLYFTGAGNLSAADLVSKLGPALKMNSTQISNLQSAFMGKMPISKPRDIAGMVYKRGVDKKVDLAVDLGVDFFQRKMGTSGLQSGLVGLAGDVLGGLINKWNQRAAEKEAEQAIILAKLSDRNVYITGFDATPHQQDIVLHQKANIKAGYSPMAGAWSPIDHQAALPDYDRVIEMYSQNPDRAYYLYQAFMQRAGIKMAIGVYKSAITDYYLAENVLNSIVNKSLPDKSIDVSWPAGYHDAANKKAYLKGKMITREFTVGYKDQLLVLIGRSFGKYRSGDYTGALADCKLASDLQTQKYITKTGQPNDYKDVLLAIQAMCKFGLGDYDAAYADFSKAWLNDELIADDDADGITNFLDWDHRGVPGIMDSAEGILYTEYFGLPRYFPFDISQIRGLVLYKAGKVDEAIEVYQNIVSTENAKAKYSGNQFKTFTKVGGDVSAVYSSLSSFYSARGQKDKAVEYIDRAILINPEYKEYQIKKESYGTAQSTAKASSKPAAPPDKDKKAMDYYVTKHEGFASSGQKEEDYALLMEAAAAYPERFNVLLLKVVKDLKDPSKAEAASKMVTDPVLKAVFEAHMHNLAGDRTKETDAIEKAFEGGLHFQDAQLYSLDLRTNPNYCKFLKNFAGRENNNFTLRPAEVEKTRTTLDSITAEQAKDPRLDNKIVKKSMADMRAKHEAKYFGTIEQYLKLLEEDENRYAAAPNEVLDQIECLIILKREADAIKFASKVIKSKKMDAVTKYVTDENTLSYVTAINNIAADSCGR